MRRALPAAGTFTLTLLLLDPIRLPELAAGLAAAAGTAAVVLLLTVTVSRRCCREVPPPAAGLPAACCRPGQSATQPMSFGDLPAAPGYRDGQLDGDESPPVDWDAIHLSTAREWRGIMRRPDEQWGTLDMTEFEERLKP